MVNSVEFAKRLGKIMDYYDLSAASFADRIQVGRSSISHILSGRNKPSLDFVMKIIQSFPEVELYWLLNGDGKFPRENNPTPSPLPLENEPLKTEKPTKEIVKNEVEKSSFELENLTETTNLPSTSSQKKIHKIVIFYKDGSFESFQN
ncbi:DNA-binding transcriptional regulator, XRE-family HTH domain [Mesonia phycicola]|uniref:DNA-binding transcriptional regulator, XRE-family HTH domain n=1 Tax=Mesonia phycicola TaxID=579105 RepID=A0A1M6BSR4_9FLAO|nr:helix-turn-helix transcriptional regulator [Mesonia phycicola]SHI51747.1 DNA-binding transcriptional regulator, XRE-family HTH domain [Mesonia phycicola]